MAVWLDAKVLPEHRLTTLVGAAHHVVVAGGQIRRHQELVGTFVAGVVCQELPHPIDELVVEMFVEQNAPKSE